MRNIDVHNKEIQENLKAWMRKPVLREIYKSFHQIIAGHLSNPTLGSVVELGSGVADITEVIPNCVRTDLFPNPWIDHVENAYDLSFSNESISSLILFDVFHHLRYPGTALREFHRVLAKHGRVILFEPSISLLGLIVYGLLHKEPIGLGKKIQWEAPVNWNSADIDYYAAQGNATTIFVTGKNNIQCIGWNLITVERLCSISYVASGGYSKPQMYPGGALPLMQKLDKLLGAFPSLFATRLIVVLEKS